MKNYLQNNLLMSLLFVFCIQITALPQTSQKKAKTKPVKTQKTETYAEKQKVENCPFEPKDSTSYYAPIRYVIVSNWLFDEKEIPERRIEILMKPEQFNEENLICIFRKISKRFPSPTDLEITVHTDLATIETPEEREMPQSSNDPRFSPTYEKYKKATYIKYSWGKEFFFYTTELFQNYKDKTVVLVDKKIP